MRDSEELFFQTVTVATARYWLPLETVLDLLNDIEDAFLLLDQESTFTQLFPDFFWRVNTILHLVAPACPRTWAYGIAVPPEIEMLHALDWMVVI